MAERSPSDVLRNELVSSELLSFAYRIWRHWWRLHSLSARARILPRHHLPYNKPTENCRQRLSVTRQDPSTVPATLTFLALHTLAETPLPIARVKANLGGNISLISWNRHWSACSVGLKWQGNQKRDQDGEDVVYLQRLPDHSTTPREWYSSDCSAGQENGTRGPCVKKERSCSCLRLKF